MIHLYGIPNCDTVKKARAWVAERGLACEFHDFKKQGVPIDSLPVWEQAVGWQKLLNRQGTTWRKLAPDQAAGVVDGPSACALMALQPSVIKRPVVEWGDGRISVGFDAQLWAQLAAS